jgi:hypothetical protein
MRFRKVEEGRIGNFAILVPLRLCVKPPHQEGYGSRKGAKSQSHAKRERLTNREMELLDA